MRLVASHLIGFYALMCLGTALLWSSETEEIFPYPLLVIFCAIISFWFTDIRGVLRIPRAVGNLMGIAVVALLIGEFYKDTPNLLLALGHFLVYLQVVKFFRRKSTADFWMLHTINLQQVTIAGVVLRELSFGLLLFLYMALAVVVLTLWTLVRHEHERGVMTLRPPIANSRRLAAPLAALIAVSLPLALVLFWALPRSWSVLEGGDGRIGPARRLLTGFSASVQLGQSGRVSESGDIVFTVRAVDHQGQPVTLSEEILWRGLSFSHYSDGRWLPGPDLSRRIGLSWAEPPRLEPGQVLITIEQAMSPAVAFCTYPLLQAGSSRRDQTLRYSRYEGQTTIHQLGTADGRLLSSPKYWQVTDLSAAAADRDQFEVEPGETYLELARQVPARLTRLRQFTSQLLSDVDTEDTRAVIERLTSHLTASGEYEYTLELPTIASGSDPVEEFLFFHRIGHCEYFASSLALMLRSAGIPARIRNGFRGVLVDDSPSNFYVPELLAHSWVEAYLVDEQRWLILDPTPSVDRMAQLSRQRTLYDRFRAGLNRLTRLWNARVIGYSLTDQRTTLRELFFRLDGVLESLGLPADTLTRGGRLAKGGVLLGLLAVVGMMGYGGWRLFPRLWRRWRRRREGVAAVAAYANHQRFPTYEAWEKLLRRRGWRRSPHQTPREFAVALREEFIADPRTRRFVHLPDQIVDWYYAVRFGDVVGDPDRVGQLERDIDEFAKMRSVRRDTQPASAEQSPREVPALAKR